MDSSRSARSVLAFHLSERKRFPDGVTHKKPQDFENFRKQMEARPELFR